MHWLKIKNIRCFAEPDPIEIRPLTLLIGENSTGKTTVMACLHTLLCFFSGHGVRFNRGPFEMGSFLEIARKKDGNGGQAEGFSLSIGGTEDSFEWGFDFSRKENGLEPRLSEIRYWAPDFRATLSGDRLVLKTASGEASVPVGEFAPEEYPTDNSPNLAMYYAFTQGCQSDRKLEELYKESYNGFYWPFSIKEWRGICTPFHSGSIHALGPIRSRPQRTYTPVQDMEDPEGSHASAYLARLSRYDKDGWRKFKQRLDRIGTALDLFKSISIRSHGKNPSDPFQIELKVAPGAAGNLISDMGYGVGQMLPVLVDVLRARERELFLIQQPEIHLHPRGQAELGSFFGRMAKEGKHTFLVETHSDYLLDRVRTDVRDKEHPLGAGDVSILYFERARKGSEVKIHNITLDKQGNFRNAPDSYRDFFIKEHQRFLGID
ncbi:MAG: AAA family ATPase [Gammaproteobacteria bacterium]|nr:AAA family ATPase [Gammaproteobacteria bacterium]